VSTFEDARLRQNELKYDAAGSHPFAANDLFERQSFFAAGSDLQWIAT
jgi:hypothetical protein